MIAHEDIDDGPLSSKLHKVWCCPCCMACNCMFHSCRKAVSGKKKRFIQNGFDLDLAYITPRIIVHGFPASGIEHLYRNPRYEIRRYLDQYHPENYKVFNFCCEPGRGYSPDVYYGRVERYPFKDHNTPPLETMTAFANSAKQWLEEDVNHVVNMHCKAGKGRAGLMCCVLLVRTGAAQSAIEAMDLYDRERVTNNRGLTVTSQRKYVIFYEALWRQVWGVQGNIGDVSAEDAAKLKLPLQPTYAVSSVELILPSVSSQASQGSQGAQDAGSPSSKGLKWIQSYRIEIYKVTNFLPIKLADSGWISASSAPKDAAGSPSALAAELSAKIEGNFKVFVSFKKGAFGKGVRLVELQHNTFFMVKDSAHVDFALDQLDVKKKIRPLLPEGITLRLHLTDSPEGETAKGYALVAVEDKGMEMVGLGERGVVEGVTRDTLGAEEGKMDDVPLDGTKA